MLYVAIYSELRKIPDAGTIENYVGDWFFLSTEDHELVRDWDGKYGNRVHPLDDRIVTVIASKWELVNTESRQLKDIVVAGRGAGISNREIFDAILEVMTAREWSFQRAFSELAYQSGEDRVVLTPNNLVFNRKDALAKFAADLQGAV